MNKLNERTLHVIKVARMAASSNLFYEWYIIYISHWDQWEGFCSKKYFTVKSSKMCSLAAPDPEKKNWYCICAWNKFLDDIYMLCTLALTDPPTAILGWCCYFFWTNATLKFHPIEMVSSRKPIFHDHHANKSWNS